MTDGRYKQWNKARDARQRGEYLEAANSFTVAAHERLGSCEYVQKPFERAAPNVSFALYSLLAAGVCYRLESEFERCENRCRHGVLYCEELRDRVVSYDAQQGIMDEYIGDFQTVGEFGAPTDSYSSALARYEEISNPIQWQAEPEFELNMTFLLDLSDSTNETIDRATKRKITTESLLDRIEYKISNFAEIVSRVAEQGEWENSN